jgi:hypothetical protein
MSCPSKEQPLHSTPELLAEPSNFAPPHKQAKIPTLLLPISQ